jgi:hypothetical protein
MKGTMMGHGAAAASTVCGIALMLFGKSVMHSGPVGDGGMYGLFGVLLIAAGGLLTIVTIGLWLFGTLSQLFGPRAVIGAIGLLVLAGYFSRPFLGRGPIQAASWGGDIRAGPGPEHEVFGVLGTGAPLLLLEATEVSSKGHLWFHARSDDGVEGFVWGGDVCATVEWINGVHDRCPPNRSAHSVGHVDFGPGIPVIDVVEQVHRLLPGKWRSSDGEEGVVEYGDQMEVDMFDTTGAIFASGFWAIQEDRSSPTNIVLRRDVRLLEGSYAYGPDFGLLSLDTLEFVVDWIGSKPSRTSTYRRVR